MHRHFIEIQGSLSWPLHPANLRFPSQRRQGYPEHRRPWGFSTIWRSRHCDSSGESRYCHNNDITVSYPCQVERALKLIASGTITIEMVQKSKGPVPTIPKQMNQSTGKASNQLTGFNEASWGARCSSYVRSAKKLSASRFDEILSLSAEYMKGGTNRDDDDDIRANIVDQPDSSSEGDTDCMWILLVFASTGSWWLIILEVLVTPMWCSTLKFSQYYPWCRSTFLPYMTCLLSLMSLLMTNLWLWLFPYLDNWIYAFFSPYMGIIDPFLRLLLLQSILKSSFLATYCAYPHLSCSLNCPIIFWYLE